jgi:hypothetical protein
MKKRTIITTEMSEIWIIHPSSPSTDAVIDIESHETEPPSSSTLALNPVDTESETEHPQEINSPTNESGK